MEHSSAYLMEQQRVSDARARMAEQRKAREAQPQPAAQPKEHVAMFSSDSLEQQVLDSIRRLGGANWKEICDDIGLERQSVSPRFAKLRRVGLIRDSGITRPGWPNSKGRAVGQTVWEACQ